MNLFYDLIDIKEEKTHGLVGLTDEFFSLYINKIFQSRNKNILIVTPTLFEANILNNSLSIYTNSTYLFPMDDFLTSESIAISPDLKITRLETLNQTFREEKKIIITHLNGYLRYLPRKKKYKESIIKLELTKEYPRNELVKNLINIGYERETIVTKTGEMGIRGFVIDVFPISAPNPLSILSNIFVLLFQYLLHHLLKTLYLVIFQILKFLLLFFAFLHQKFSMIQFHRQKILFLKD